MRREPPAWIRPRILVLAACLLTLTGCRQGSGAHDDHDHDHEEHAGHVKPVHRPDTFPEAVERLRGLHDRIGAEHAGGRPPAESLRIALDIAKWLPEIAAESDMPEAPWNEVHAASAALAVEFQRLSEGRPGQEAAAVRASAERIVALERVLASAGPKWFPTVRRVASTDAQDSAADGGGAGSPGTGPSIQEVKE
jgi:hypothetical protein